MLNRKSLDDRVRSARSPVAIFDLDGTVFDVTYRTIEILKRFLELPDVAERFPAQSRAARGLRYSDYGYSLEASLNNIGLDRYSELAATFLHEAETFWYKHFFTNELLAFDKPYPGARQCVKHLHESGVQIVYLSGRDIPNMSQGTLASLEEHGFPHTGHGVALCLKPAYGQDDLLFKKQAIETIGQQGDVVFTIDNEPANVKLFLERFPLAFNVHFDSLYAKPLELSGSNYASIKSFAQIGF